MSAARPPAIPCAVCGGPVRRTARTRPRKIICPRCRYRIYDYPRVCAGAVVLKGDAMLVLRRGEAPRRGWLDLPGGFVEAGEALEAAARRELFEETGLRVRSMEPLGLWWDRYYLRGFGWIPTMNFYWLGRWTRGTPRAADDAASAEWVPLGALGKREARFAWKHLVEVARRVYAGRGLRKRFMAPRPLRGPAAPARRIPRQ